MPTDEVPSPEEEARALARMPEIERRAAQRRLRRSALLGAFALVLVVAIAVPLATRGGRTREVNAATGSKTTSTTAALSTSTTVSPTTSTSLASGPTPTAPNCNPGAVGSGIKPSLIFFGCATSADYLSDIHWATWDATTATGTATHNRNACISGEPNAPSCADGSYKSYPVSVTLTNPGTVKGEYVFRTITLSATSAGESPEATALLCGSGSQNHCDVPDDSWGWVPN